MTTILTVSGSPRENGYSEKMLACCKDTLIRQNPGDSIRLRHYNAHACAFAPCIDCRVCCKQEGCLYDDMDAFFRDFESADGIVIATPIYNMSFPAPLKVIADRMQRYFNARFSLGKRPPIAKHRPVVLLMSAGDPREDGAVAIQQLSRIFTVTNCSLIGQVCCGGTDTLTPNAPLPPAVTDEITACVNQFIDSMN